LGKTVTASEYIAALEDEVGRLTVENLRLRLAVNDDDTSDGGGDTGPAADDGVGD
jgi:hypothetical protein